MKFLIVDGNSLACRAAFAHNPNFGPDLMTSSGKETGATYRFINMFDKLLHRLRPTHAVIGWDVGKETFRNQLDPTYKGNREKKNEDLYTQFVDIKRIISAIGIKNVGVQGYEGDDVIGTYVELSKAERNYIVTGDKDSFQLVDSKTFVVYPNGSFKDIQFITEEYISEKYGIPYKNFVDLKALMGDAGDNIKGIDGCAEKTAAKLINHYGSIDEIVKNAGDINLKGINKTVKAGILEWVPRSEIVKKLVTIRRDVPVPYSFNQCELNLNWLNAEDIFKELEMGSFVKKLSGGEFYNGEE